MGDVFATIYKAFGIDWTKEYDTPIGRPIKIANSLEDTTGEPIAELASSLFGVGKAKSNEVHWVLGASRGMEARSQ